MPYSFAGFSGVSRFVTAQDRCRKAVKGMLPKNTLGRNLLKKLKIYASGEHPHEAQQPKPLEL